MSRKLLGLPVALLLSCGAESPPEPPPVGEGPASVIVQNRSPYPLTELRFHRELDYDTANNVLTSELPVDGEIILYGNGAWNVTAFRQKNYRGPLRAYSTAEPLLISEGGGYRLSIFGEQFRLSKEDRITPGPDAKHFD